MKKSACPEAGTACYVINKQWIERYKKYVFYENLTRDTRPTQSPDHCKTNHPGKVDNEKLLQTEAKFLQGTGTLKGFDADVYDTYLKEDVKEGSDFEFCTEEMWQFVNSRYGSDFVIKRYYQKSKYSYYSEVELRLKFIPVIICSGSKLIANYYN